MKKGLKIFIIILFLVIVGLVTYIITDKIVNKPQESNNTVTTTNSTDYGNTVVNTTVDNTAKNEKNVANTTNDTKNNSKDDARRIEISDDEVLDILLKAKEFERVSDLTDQDKLEIVYHALNEKKVKAYSNRKHPTNDGIVEFTKEEINGIVYSIFGVKLDKFESWEDGLVYKDGKYTLYYSDGGGDTYVAKNIERDSAAGTAYTEYDLYYSDMDATPVNKGRFVIARSGVTSFVSSKTKAK